MHIDGKSNYTLFMSSSITVIAWCTLLSVCVWERKLFDSSQLFMQWATQTWHLCVMRMSFFLPILLYSSATFNQNEHKNTKNGDIFTITTAIGMHIYKREFHLNCVSFVFIHFHHLIRQHFFSIFLVHFGMWTHCIWNYWNDFYGRAGKWDLQFQFQTIIIK